jgi:hypothetical protein
LEVYAGESQGEVPGTVRQCEGCKLNVGSTRDHADYFSVKWKWKSAKTIGV